MLISLVAHLLRSRITGSGFVSSGNIRKDWQGLVMAMNVCLTRSSLSGRGSSQRPTYGAPRLQGGYLTQPPQPGARLSSSFQGLCFSDLPGYLFELGGLALWINGSVSEPGNKFTSSELQTGLLGSGQGPCLPRGGL